MFHERQGVRIINSKESQGKCVHLNRVVRSKFRYLINVSKSSGFNWVEKLPEVLPFHEYLSKRSFRICNSFSIVLLQSPCHDGSYMPNNVRCNAENASKRCRNIIVKRCLSKTPVSFYSVGERIWVRFPTKGRRVPTRRQIFPGLVIDKKLHSLYKVLYKSPSKNIAEN